MFKNAKCWLIPTYQINNALRGYNNKTLLFNYQTQYNVTDAEKEFTSYYHLYFTTNERPKIGEWYIVKLYDDKNNPYMSLEQVKSLTKDIWINNERLETTRHIENCFKVIVTTNQHIGVVKYTEGGNVINGGIPCQYPKPPLYYINTFIFDWNLGDEITEVRIEYRHNDFKEFYLNNEQWSDYLKINDSNEVNIKKLFKVEDYITVEILKQAQQAILCNQKDAAMNDNYIIEYLSNLINI